MLADGRSSGDRTPRSVILVSVAWQASGKADAPAVFRQTTVSSLWLACHVHQVISLECRAVVVRAALLVLGTAYIHRAATCRERGDNGADRLPVPAWWMMPHWRQRRPKHCLLRTRLRPHDGASVAACRTQRALPILTGSPAVAMSAWTPCQA